MQALPSACQALGPVWQDDAVNPNGMNGMSVLGCVLDEVSDGQAAFDREARRFLDHLDDIGLKAQRRRAIRRHEHICGLLMPIPGERARARRIEELLAA